MVGDLSTPLPDRTSFASALTNQAQVLAYGIGQIPSGFKQAADNALSHPLPTIEKLGLSTAISLGVGLLASRVGPLGCVVRGLGIAGAVNFGADVAKPLASAMSAAWGAQNEQQLDAASSQLGSSLGALAFDTVLQSPFCVAWRVNRHQAKRPTL